MMKIIIIKSIITIKFREIIMKLIKDKIIKKIIKLVEKEMKTILLI